MTPFDRRSVQNYDQLIEAVRKRLDDLQICHKDVDRLAGLSSGYISKIVGDARKKTLGLEALFFLADALAIRIELVPDENLLRLMEGRYEKCVVNKRVLKRSPPLGNEIVRRVASQTGKLGKGIPKTFRISPQQLGAIRSKAAKARWKRHRLMLRAERKAQRAMTIEAQQPPQPGAAT